MVSWAVETHALAKRYGDIVALDALDLRVAPGEVYGLLGLNGAGKTTATRILTGITTPSGGRAIVAGRDVTRERDALAGRIGVVFGDNIAPEPAMSSIRYLRHVAAMHDIPREEADAHARQLFEVLRLDKFAERPIGKLSGGNQRKVEIARALLPGPEVLFLDEPTRELDIPAKRATWTLLADLARGGMTIFLSSHDVQEIASTCTRIGILQQGRLSWEGAPGAIAREGEPLADALATRLEEAPGHVEVRHAP